MLLAAETASSKLMLVKVQLQIQYWLIGFQVIIAALICRILV